MASSLLDNALAAIAVERGKRYERSFELVNALLGEFGEAGVANRLYAAIPVDCSLDVVADLFNILLWSTSDNGAAIGRTAEEWLRSSSDLRKLTLALSLESYPFINRGEMETVLRKVAKRVPQLAARCEELIMARCKLPE